MAGSWNSSDEPNRLQVTGLFYQFVYEQFRQWEMARQLQVESLEMAEQIEAYIQEHYAHSISMENMATHFHYSTHYLARVFKRKYGCSPMDYVIQTRIKRAKHLLTETEAQVREVAESVGYKDLSILAVFSNARQVRHRHSIKCTVIESRFRGGS